MTEQFHLLPDGKRMRYAIFNPEHPPRATLVVAPGRREFIEKKYIEIGHEFLERGFRLIIFDRRGQGLSDRMLSGDKRQRDHIADFNIFLNDFSSFYEKVIKPNRVGKLVFTGHSMGGHLILRWLAENAHEPVDGAFLTSPMMALASLPAHTITYAISWLEVKLGHGDSYATTQHDYNEADREFVINPLTHDEKRFSIIENYFSQYPDMIVGGITWDWLHAALRSMHTLQRPSYLAAIKNPILTLMGSKDHVTPPHEVTRYLGYLSAGTYHIIQGAMHDVLNEQDSYRCEAWSHLDSFLQTIMGDNN